jgi:surface antigen
MKFIKKIAAIASILAITACTNESGEISKQGILGVGGAIGGGIIGSNVGKGKGTTAAIIAGTVLGGLAGSEVGKSLDKADAAYLNRTQQQAFEHNRSGTTSSWKNPDSGASGSVTPTKTYESSGRHCREYTQTINVGGKTEKGYGTACRTPDGSWEIVK